MSQRVVLFSLIPETKFGGSAVQSAHLYRSFQLMGYDPLLVRVGARTETRSRPYTHGVPYYNVSADDAVRLAKSYPSLITYIHWQTNGEVCQRLFREGVPIIVTDPVNFYQEMIDSIKANSIKVVGIRRGNTQVLKQDYGLDACFIPQPFVRATPDSAPRTKHAVNLSRVDFRKHQEIICAANRLLEPSQRVQMYGHLNRMYAFHKLDKDFPEWRENYHGTLDIGWGSTQKLLSDHRFAIDLTVIKQSNDGDGSQYLFMEAWDTGTPLVVHRGWIRTGKDEVRDGETALAIASPEDLKHVLTESSQDQLDAVVAGGYAQLDEHRPELIIPQYTEIMQCTK